MFGGNRLHHLALGGSLAFLLLAIPALGQQSGGPEVTSPAPQQTEPLQADSGGPPAATVPAEEQSSSAVERDAEYDAQHYAKADLAAQESMAASTEALVALTDRQITYTAIEAGLLAVTIFFTAWAAVAAGRAAKAADMAVEVTREGIERELRAYLSFTTIETLTVMDHFNETRPRRVLGYNFRLTVENAGQTPALECSIKGAISMVDIADDPDFPAVPDAGVRSDVGPRSFVYGQVLGVERNQIQAVLERKKRLFLWWRAEYRDVFKGAPERLAEGVWEVEIHRNPEILYPGDPLPTHSCNIYGHRRMS